MIRIGIVGDIGCGKTFVANKFGYPVFNADLEVNKLYKTDRNCFRKLNKILPKYITSFPIAKEVIALAILKNRFNLKKIIKIMHPLVRKKMNKFLVKNKNKKIVVLDIPLFLENKINKKKDVLNFVDAKKKEIEKRLKKKINCNSKIIKKFKKLQLPVEFKKKESDFTIKNNFRNNSIKKNVKKVLEKILLNARSYT